MLVAINHTYGSILVRFNETPDIQNEEKKEVEGEVIKMQGMIELAVM